MWGVGMYVYVQQKEKKAQEEVRIYTRVYSKIDKNIIIPDHSSVTKQTIKA